MTTIWTRQLANSALGCGLCAGLVAVGCDAPLGSSTERVSQGVNGGALDAVDRAVFGVLTRPDGGNALCSASLIAPNLMLTARHCVAPTTGGSNVNCKEDEFTDPIATGNLKFSNATTPQWYDRWFGTAQILVEDAPGMCGHDIAVILLSEAVPEEVAVPLSLRLDPPVQVNELYTAVGYGEDSDDPDVAQSGTRRRRTGLRVECVGRDCNSEVEPSEFGGTASVCGGDSGGPALDSEGRVIGVLSRGTGACGAPVYTGVWAFRALLVPLAERASSLSGAPLPEWAGGPQPAPSGAAVPDAEVRAVDAGTFPEPGVAPQLAAESCTLAAGRVSPRSPFTWLGLLAATYLIRRRAHQGIDRAQRAG